MGIEYTAEVVHGLIKEYIKAWIEPFTYGKVTAEDICNSLPWEGKYRDAIGRLFREGLTIDELSGTIGRNKGWVMSAFIQFCELYYSHSAAIMLMLKCVNNEQVDNLSFPIILESELSVKLRKVLYNVNCTQRLHLYRTKVSSIRRICGMTMPLLQELVDKSSSMDLELDMDIRFDLIGVRNVERKNEAIVDACCQVLGKYQKRYKQFIEPSAAELRAIYNSCDTEWQRAIAESAHNVLWKSTTPRTMLYDWVFAAYDVDVSQLEIIDY